MAAPITRPEGGAGGDCFATFERELDYLYGTLRRLRVPGADVEDLAHEVFLILHRRWCDYDPSAPIRPWLFGIAYRVAAAHRRKSRRELPRPSLEIEDPAPSADGVLSAQQARRIVLAALDEIPLPRRAVLVMHDIDGVAMREIAKTLSIPLFTAYSRLRKARRELETAARGIQYGANRK